MYFIYFIAISITTLFAAEIPDAGSITSLATIYNTFQHEYGQREIENVASKIEDLFAPNLKKIGNRKVMADGRDALEPQLKSVRELAGKWSIDVKEIIPSADNKKCTVRYELVSEKAGSFDVIVILSSTDGKKIDSLDEIYYQMVS